MLSLILPKWVLERILWDPTEGLMVKNLIAEMGNITPAPVRQTVEERLNPDIQLRLHSWKPAMDVILFSSVIFFKEANFRLSSRVGFCLGLVVAAWEQTFFSPTTTTHSPIGGTVQHWQLCQIPQSGCNDRHSARQVNSRLGIGHVQWRKSETMQDKCPKKS